jgi:16S rRNA (guanine527-N7)-methyltransferase
MDQAGPLIEEAQELGVELDDVAAQRLLAYEGLLATRGTELGIISRADVPRIRARHTLDSLRGVLAIAPSDSSAYDLGAGGGLPGLPVSIAFSGLRVTLVESRRNRAAFLELAIDRLGLNNAEVAPGRIEDLSQPTDVCFARALARLPRCWELAAGLLRPGGRLVYFAGAGFRPEELRDLPGAAAGEILRAPSLASSGALVIIGRL